MNPPSAPLQVQLLLEPHPSVEDFLSREGTVFHSYAHLSARPGQYYCAVVLQGQEILAAWPLLLSRRGGILGFFLPTFTYRYGPVLKPSHEASCLLKMLYEILPPYSMVLKCPLPLGSHPLWQQWGFEVSLHQSNLLPEGYGPLHMNLRKRQYLKRALRDLEEGNVLETVENNPPQRLYRYTDASGLPLGSLLCLYDHRYLYHLKPDFPKGSILGILSFYHAALWAQDRGLTFDTEGSQIPGVDLFYKQMGGIGFQYAYLERYRGWAKILVPLKRGFAKLGKAVFPRVPNRRAHGNPG